MRNLLSYEQYLITEALDTSEIAEIKKAVSEKLRTEVEYTESSGLFTCNGLALVDFTILEDILKDIGFEGKNIKLNGTLIAGSTEFEIKK
jgi:hypothetical protein